MNDTQFDQLIAVLDSINAGVAELCVKPNVVPASAKLQLGLSKQLQAANWRIYDLLVDEDDASLEAESYLQDHCTGLYAKLKKRKDINPNRTKWQAMDTAPKDGTSILVKDATGTVVSACWIDGPRSYDKPAWTTNIIPTSWMHIPK